MHNFMQFINSQHHTKFNDYPSLYTWSIQEPEAFWKSTSDFTNIKYHTEAHTIRQTGAHMLETQWFLGATLNYAENCLSQNDDDTAIIEVSENNHITYLKFGELKKEVARVAHYLRSIGITQHDRVAGIVNNDSTAIISMLAATSLGATWSSCSPDFGYAGLMDRLKQIKPKALFTVVSHQYNNKIFDHTQKIRRIQHQLKLQHLILIDSTHSSPPISNSIRLNDLPETNQSLTYTPVPFSHPLFIMFSSGTTGLPKCMVHSVGGTLLQHKKEHQLHCDIRAKEILFFYTTTGWMMWNWMSSALASGSTIVTYNGSPTLGTPDRLCGLIDIININHFGIAAKLIEHMETHNCNPKKELKLNSLRSIMTTGSPLLPKSFDYVYNFIKHNVRLSSISGGTDIISCFALGNPTLPVYRGQLQCAGLGMDIKIFNENGNTVINQPGELVCCSAFPSMPTQFLNDPDKEKYHSAYFSEFKNIWAHKDYAMITLEGGIVITGRSDTTLNPGGIRIGTAEIYRQLQKIDCIIESIATSLYTTKGEKVILFLILKKPHQLNDAMVQKIKDTICQGTSHHHKPYAIYAVNDLPRTLNGKLSETAVKKAVNGEEITNHNTLLNPTSLEPIKKIAKNIL